MLVAKPHQTSDNELVSDKKITRRDLFKASALTAVGATLIAANERAEAFYNMGAFWKKPTGNGQTSNGYTIGQSLRFNSTNSAYLSRTPSSAGNRTTWTFSAWVKRGSLGGINCLFSAGVDGSNRTGIHFHTANGVSNDSIQLFHQQAGTVTLQKITTAAFRDPTAWYHVVVAINTNNSAPTNARLYLNGTEVTSWQLNTNTLATGASLFVNATNAHYQGQDAGGSLFFDGYLAEINFIDGAAYDATYFGQVDAYSGQWIPKSYTGAYGLNGFYLKFADNSATTAATLGKDSAAISGAHTVANNWTPTNFQSYDQVLDSPTNNFATINRIWSGPTNNFSGGALSYQRITGNTWSGVTSTQWASSGKWYCEVTINAVGGSGSIVGITQNNINAVNEFNGGGPNQLCISTESWGYYNSDAGIYHNSNSAQFSTGTTFTTGSVIGIALNLDAGSAAIYKDGTAIYSGNPVFTSLASGFWTFCSLGSSGGTPAQHTFNFGQGGQSGLTYYSAAGGSFKYAPPTGFKALSTANLTVPTVKKSSQYFNATTWTGNAAVRSITGLGHQPDLVWIKARNTTTSHNLTDSVRTATKQMFSDLTNIETTVADTLTSFNADGFSLGADSLNYGVNFNTQPYVAWCWKAGTFAQAGAESYNAAAGFSIVSYTGNGSARNISHSLGVTPSMFIIKDRDSATTDWHVWFQGFANSDYLFLDQTAGKVTYAGLWNSGHASNTIGIGGVNGINANTRRHIAYLWAEVPGFSKFGSYTGNGSADGPFVYCGFKPRYILIKRTDTTGNWRIWDSARNSGNPTDLNVWTNSNGVEGSGNDLDILSNGFKQRQTWSDQNASGGTYIYAAFAEAPFKYATAR